MAKLRVANQDLSPKQDFIFGLALPFKGFEAPLSVLFRPLESVSISPRADQLGLVVAKHYYSRGG
jgi:hypothetical protein